MKIRAYLSGYLEEGLCVVDGTVEFCAFWNKLFRLVCCIDLECLLKLIQLSDEEDVCLGVSLWLPKFDYETEQLCNLWGKTWVSGACSFGKSSFIWKKVHWTLSVLPVKARHHIVFCIQSLLVEKCCSGSAWDKMTIFQSSYKIRFFTNWVYLVSGLKTWLVNWAFLTFDVGNIIRWFGDIL